MEFSKTFFLRMKKEKLLETSVSMGLTNEYSVAKYGKPANKLLKSQLIEWIETIGKQDHSQQLQQLFSQLSLKTTKTNTNTIDDVIECVVAGSGEVEPQRLNISVYEPLPDVPEFQTNIPDIVLAPPQEFSDNKKTVTFDMISLTEEEPIIRKNLLKPQIQPLSSPLASYGVIYPPPAVPPTNQSKIKYPPPAVAPISISKPIIPPPAVAPISISKSIIPPPAVAPVCSLQQTLHPDSSESSKSLGAIPKKRSFIVDSPEKESKTLKSLLRQPSVFESPSVFDLPIEQPVLVLTEPEIRKEPVVNVINNAPSVKLVKQDVVKIPKKKEDVRTQILNAKDVADVLKAIRNPNTVHISSISQVDYNISRTFGLCY